MTVFCRSLLWFTVVVFSFGLWTQSATAQSAKVRIKDLVEFDGVRGNDLLGYGLVVGLNGTGDGIRNSPFTELSLAGAIDLPVEISFWVLFSPILIVFKVCSATRLLELVRMLDIFDPLDERQLLLPNYVRPPVSAAVSVFLTNADTGNPPLCATPPGCRDTISDNP